MAIMAQLKTDAYTYIILIEKMALILFLLFSVCYFNYNSQDDASSDSDDDDNEEDKSDTESKLGIVGRFKTAQVKKMEAQLTKEQLEAERE